MTKPCITQVSRNNNLLLLGCDLAETGIFKVRGTEYEFADGYKVKLALKNPATCELLQNKGKLWKIKAKLQHKKDGAYSGKFNL